MDSLPARAFEQRTGERRHTPDADPWWAETWSFDVTAIDRSISTFATLTVLPNQSTCWYWAAVVGTDRRYVLCRDDELTVPSNKRPLEVRGGGLWMHAICEEPWRHWTVAMEAFAIAFDDPTEEWRSERGDRVGLAFDLEWESLTSGHDLPYEIPCRVSGDLQVGDELLPINATGWRSHRWGSLESVLALVHTGRGTAIFDAPLLALTREGALEPIVRRLIEPTDPADPPRWITCVAPVD